MTLKKTAAYDRAMVPVNEKGERLYRNEDGQLVTKPKPDANGRVSEPTVFDPQGVGLKPSYIEVPVYGSNDINKDTFPYESRLINLPKYQKIIQELKMQAKMVPSGIVNFVVGQETVMVDLILRCAFPPGSGVVFGGSDGFQHDVSNADVWSKNADDAVKKLKTTIYGNIKTISPEELKFVKKFDATLLASIDQRNETDVAPITIQELWFPNTIEKTRNGLPAQNAPAAQPGARPQATSARPGAGPQQLEQISIVMERVAELIKRLKNEQNKYNPNDNTHPAQGGLSPRECYRRCAMEIFRAERLYNLVRTKGLASMPSVEGHPCDVHPVTGQLEYDGTGFMDFKNKILASLGFLSDPEMLYRQMTNPKFEKERSDWEKSAEGREFLRTHPKGTLTKPVIKIYDDTKQTVINELRGLKNVSAENVALAIDSLIDVLTPSCQEILANKESLISAITRFGVALSSGVNVLLLNNVDRSGLVQHAPDGSSCKLSDPGALDRFFSERKRRADRGEKEKKTLIFVSRVPISIGVGGVEQVPRDASELLVDDQEAEIILDYWIDKARQSYLDLLKGRKTGTTQAEKEKAISQYTISHPDKKKISRMLTGKTHVDASNFVINVVNAAFDSEKKMFNGSNLVKIAKRKHNEAVASSSKWKSFSDSSEQRGIFELKKELSIDKYMIDERSDWGTAISNQLEKLDTAHDEQTVANALREYEQKIVQGIVKVENRGAVLGKLRAEIAERERNRSQNLKGIPHFMILWGTHGCGKSAYPEALAHKLGFDYFDVDFGQARGQLVGQTEGRSKLLIDAIKNMSDAVIRMDEIDNQLVNEDQERFESHGGNVVSQLLKLFQDHMTTLEERNVFVIATTNNLSHIRRALKDRAEAFRVPSPYNKANYTKFLTHALEILEAKRDGYIYDVNYNANQSANKWPETKALWSTIKGEIPAIAEALTQTGMVYRSLLRFIETMFAKHMTYEYSKKAVHLYETNRAEFERQCDSYVIRNEKGEKIGVKKPQLKGVPFTAANFLRAVQLTRPINSAGEVIDVKQAAMDDEEGMVRSGIPALERELWGVADTAPQEAPSAQLDLGLDISGDDGDLMKSPGKDTIASVDYYYAHLLKAGFKGAGQQLVNAPPPQETEKQQLLRIDSGDIRESDVIDDWPFLVLPVPSDK